ncbi:hypothetical protein evm_014764, partial [Chilo suppressalis]
PSYVVTLADIDECEQHPALCEHGTCTNTFGSFVCTCGDGWLLADDEQRCIDVDECAEPDICGVGICRNMPGSYVCLCPEGYVPMPSNKECVDIRQRQCYLEWDEESGRCSNAAGAPQTRHVCCCSAGRAWGAPCSRCPAPGAPDHVALCGARPGQYVNPVTNETRRINECDIMPQLCKPGLCHDTADGFTCGCDHGYEHDNTSHLCRDIDECALGVSRCRGMAQCVNTPGSYECRCPPGYRLMADIEECEDVDECADRRLCDHGDCRNTVGSFRCDCQPGYTLRDNVCRDVDECSRPRPMCRNGTCENLPGSYACHCDEGFKPGPNNDCIDYKRNVSRQGADGVPRNGSAATRWARFRCSARRALHADGMMPQLQTECALHVPTLRSITSSSRYNQIAAGVVKGNVGENERILPFFKFRQRNKLMNDKELPLRLPRAWPSATTSNDMLAVLGVSPTAFLRNGRVKSAKLIPSVGSKPVNACAAAETRKRVKKRKRSSTRQGTKPRSGDMDLEDKGSVHRAHLLVRRPGRLVGGDYRRCVVGFRRFWACRELSAPLKMGSREGKRRAGPCLVGQVVNARFSYAFTRPYRDQRNILEVSR